MTTQGPDSVGVSSVGSGVSLDLNLTSASEKLRIYINFQGLWALLCEIKVITISAYRLF